MFLEFFRHAVIVANIAQLCPRDIRDKILDKVGQKRRLLVLVIGIF